MKNLKIKISHDLGEKEVYACTIINGEFFEGVAICNKKDKFVLQTGADLATQRLKQKVAAYLIKQNENKVKKIFKKMRKLRTEAEKLDEYNYDVLERELRRAESQEYDIMTDEGYRNYYEE